MQVVTEYTARALGSLITVEVLSEITTVSIERILELVGLKMIPHLRIDNGPPVFRRAESVKWIKENLIEEFEGKSLPIVFSVTNVDTAKEPLPTALSQMDGKIFQGIPDSCSVPPCIYFLVAGGCIVYVGQSTNLPARLVDHRLYEKNWDRVLWLPVPYGQMNVTEQWWIMHLKPPLNQKANFLCEKGIPPAQCIPPGVK